MSFYALAIYFWCAVAGLGITAPLVWLAAEFLGLSVARWLSSIRKDEPVISSRHGPMSCP